MKKNDILNCLKSCKDIDGYELSITSKDSRELFYVLKHLEINRAVKTTTTTIKVYAISKKEGTGSSLITVTAADDKASLTKEIKKAIAKAKNNRNNYYPLAKKTNKASVSKESKKDLNAICNNIAKAVFKADKYKDGWINSTEIFVSKYTNEFISSTGIKQKSNSFKINIEIIPTWSNKKEEYELYKFIESGKVDYPSITKEVDEILTLAKDRSIAKKIDDVNLPNDLLVLVKNDMRDLLVNNLANNMSYYSKYTKVNHYEIKDVISKNKFDLTMKPDIAGCVNSRRYDDNGVTLKARKIISKGIACDNYGDIRYGHYLGAKKISGDIPLCELSSKGFDYKKSKHLIIETFSSPQLDENIGYWGGEVRLARYFDGKKYIPLTGFSISGNIYDDLKNIKFSSEKVTSSSYKGPKYFIFDTINIF